MKRRHFCAALTALPFLIGTQHARASSPHTTFDLEPRSINPRYMLIGPQGSAVSNEDFRGRFQLITFGYTFCPDICPTTLVDIAEALKLLGTDAERVQAIFISVDPERDNPQQLATYTAFFDQRIIGLTGSPALVQAAARNFKVRYEKVVGESEDPKNYAVDHSAGIYLLGPESTFIKKFAYATPPASIANDIRQLISSH
ncbi:SCO family protein [Azonexus sp.]|uniref:SCO family protein n=1 Tax=Azonexus sp. TaxID=1872668 RepID=UPI0039E5298F